jgi:hypothetical protein
MILHHDDWMPVVGFSGRYKINKRGIVLSLQKNHTYKEIQVRKDRAGYLTVRLFYNGQTHTRFLHRLIAAAFVPNPDNLQFVNHINGNKLDNRPENLEWVTHGENVKHAYDMGLISNTNKTRGVIDMCSGQAFSSAREAADHYKMPYSTCKNYLNGTRPNPTCLQYAAGKAA